MLPHPSQMNECLSRAAACRWRAAMTTDPEIRATNLDAARQWETMAGNIEKLGVERKQD